MLQDMSPITRRYADSFRYLSAQSSRARCPFRAYEARRQNALHARARVQARQQELTIFMLKRARGSVSDTLLRFISMPILGRSPATAA